MYINHNRSVLLKEIRESFNEIRENLAGMTTELEKMKSACDRMIDYSSARSPMAPVVRVNDSDDDSESPIWDEYSTDLISEEDSEMPNREGRSTDQEVDETSNPEVMDSPNLEPGEDVENLPSMMLSSNLAHPHISILIEKLVAPTVKTLVESKGSLPKVWLHSGFTSVCECFGMVSMDYVYLHLQNVGFSIVKLREANKILARVSSNEGSSYDLVLQLGEYIAPVDVPIAWLLYDVKEVWYVQTPKDTDLVAGVYNGVHSFGSLGMAKICLAGVEEGGFTVVYLYSFPIEGTVETASGFSMPTIRNTNFSPEQAPLFLATPIQKYLFLKVAVSHPLMVGFVILKGDYNSSTKFVGSALIVNNGYGVILCLGFESSIPKTTKGYIMITRPVQSNSIYTFILAADCVLVTCFGFQMLVLVFQCSSSLVLMLEDFHNSVRVYVSFNDVEWLVNFLWCSSFGRMVWQMLGSIFYGIAKHVYPWFFWWLNRHLLGYFQLLFLPTSKSESVRTISRLDDPFVKDEFSLQIQRIWSHVHYSAFSVAALSHKIQLQAGYVDTVVCAVTAVFQLDAYLYRFSILCTGFLTDVAQVISMWKLTAFQGWLQLTKSATTVVVQVNLNNMLPVLSTIIITAAPASDYVDSEVSCGALAHIQSSGHELFRMIIYQASTYAPTSTAVQRTIPVSLLFVELHSTFRMLYFEDFTEVIHNYVVLWNWIKAMVVLLSRFSAYGLGTTTVIRNVSFVTVSDVLYVQISSKLVLGLFETCYTMIGCLPCISMSVVMGYNMLFNHVLILTILAVHSFDPGIHSKVVLSAEEQHTRRYGDTPNNIGSRSKDFLSSMYGPCHVFVIFDSQMLECWGMWLARSGTLVHLQWLIAWYLANYIAKGE